MDISALKAMIGRSVRVDRGGPESRTGKLIAVKPDHFIVYIENEGLLYYKNDHIKSMSLDTRDISDLIDDPNAAKPVLSNYLDVDDFSTVMQNMKYRWVQVNRGGPEKLEGVLVDASDEKVLIICGNEIVQLLPFHIRNISYGMIKNNQQQNKNNNNQDGNKQDDGKQDDAKQEDKQEADKQDDNRESVVYRTTVVKEKKSRR